MLGSLFFPIYSVHEISHPSIVSKTEVLLVDMALPTFLFSAHTSFSVCHLQLQLMFLQLVRAPFWVVKNPKIGFHISIQHTKPHTVNR